MYHQIAEKTTHFGPHPQTTWKFILNLYSHEEMLEFLDWAYSQYGMEGQYDPLFKITVGYDGQGSQPSVQYTIVTKLDDNQAMKWKLRWGSGK